MTLVVLLGAALLAGGLAAWRFAAAQSAHRVLREALGHHHPEVRRAAIASLGGAGLRRHGRLLLLHAVGERDPAVVAELVRVVGHHDWEPRDSAEVAQLRRWAREGLLDIADGTESSPADDGPERVGV